MLWLASVSALCIVCYLDSTGTFCLLNLELANITNHHLQDVVGHPVQTFVPCLQDILKFALRLC